MNNYCLEEAACIPTPGSEFFYSLAEHLARAVDAHCTWIAESVSGPEPMLRTLGVSVGGRDAANFEYPIAGTPAQDMFDDTGICFFPSGVQERFPGDATLRYYDAGGYAGIPLVDTNGEVLGLLAVTSPGPLANMRQLASQLRICASRATAELEKMRADAVLRASEARLKLIFDHAPDACLLLTLDGKLLEANRAAERLTGLSRAEMVGRNVLLPGIMPEADIRRAAARLQVRAAGAPASQEEFTILHRNGSKAFAETDSALATVDGERVMLLCMRDITRRKIADQERQNRIDRIQRLQSAALALATHEIITIGSARQIAAHATRTVCESLDAAGVSIRLFSGAEGESRCLDRFEAGPGRVGLEAEIRTGERIGGVLRIEQAAGDARRWEPEEIQFVETVAILLGQWLLSADRGKVESRLELVQRAAAVGTWERDLATGNVEWSDEALRIYGGNDGGSDAVPRVLTGEPSRISFPIQLPDGSRRFLRELAEIEKNAAGEPVRIRGVVQDITEIRNMEEQLQTAQRLDWIGRMTTEIAHEFGDLLTVIQGHAARIGRKPTDGNTVRTATEAILGACQNASGFIRQLLGFSQPPTTTGKRDVNSIVRDFERILRSVLSPGVEVTLKLDPESGTTEAGESEIHQILISLAANAAGHLVIETARRGSWVTLVASHIRDSASISALHGLVDRCGGRIEVEGTGAKIFLPRAQADESNCEEYPLADDGIRGTETILVVEDQEEVRTLACITLESLGYKVLSAPNADAALRLELECRAPIDLLLTDMVMPGMQGDELAERLRGLRPSLKILIMSGYTTQASVQKNDTDRGRGFIRKPFDPFVLAARIRHLLDANCESTPLPLVTAP
jgi:PAS domain S-box-containing protein